MMLQQLPNSVVYQHHDQVQRHYHSRSSSPTSTPTAAMDTSRSVIIKRTHSTEDLATLREQRQSCEDMMEEHRRWYIAANAAAVVKQEPTQIIVQHRSTDYEDRESDYESPGRERSYQHAERYEQREEAYEAKEVREDADTEGPLDLSMNKYKMPRRDRDDRDSGTDSEDSSGGNGDDQAPGRAYKKSLMKRYCKSHFAYTRLPKCLLLESDLRNLLWLRV